MFGVENDRGLKNSEPWEYTITANQIFNMLKSLQFFYWDSMGYSSIICESVCTPEFAIWRFSSSVELRLPCTFRGVSRPTNVARLV